MPHVGQEMLTLFGTPDFTPFDFTHSLYILYITELIDHRISESEMSAKDIPGARKIIHIC